MDKKSKIPSSILLSGYIFSLGFYFIWCFYFFIGRQYTYNSLLLIAVVVLAITAVYLFPFILISYIKSFQKIWTSFSLVSIITLLIFFLIPPANSLIYRMCYYNKLNPNRDKTIKTIENNEPESNFLVANNIKINKQLEDAKEKMQTEQKRMEEIETKLNNSLETNDFVNTPSAELQAKLKSERNENDKLRKKLKVDNTDLDSIGQEIIFKIQIISSDTILSINSPKLKGLKNVWEYKEGGLYKYTVGNAKDLKSASVLQSEFRRKGFVGAFVVAFKNGKRIPVREALKLLN